MDNIKKIKETTKVILQKTTDVKKLAREKAEAYRNYMLAILTEAIRMVEAVQYEMPKDLHYFIFESPAGDCMGSDNSPIDFGIETEADFKMAFEYMTEMLKFANGMTSIEDFTEPLI